MGVQQIQGSFRSDPEDGIVNCFDVLTLTTSNAAWSGGDTLIDSLGPQNQNTIATPTWTLLQASVTANLQASLGRAGCKPGKIMAGIVRGTTPTQSVIGPPPPLPDASYILPLPADTSLIEALWDPATDPFPPNGNVVPPRSNPSQPPSLNVTAEISLPQPIKIDPSTELGIGIWIEPTLVIGTTGSTYEMKVLAAQWSLTYDDGLPG